MAGVILACTFGKASMAFHFTGFLFSALSTIIFVLQSIISKKILSGGDAAGAGSSVPMSSTNLGGGSAKYDPLLPTSVAAAAVPKMAKLDKINIMYYSSLMAFATMIPMWLTSDVPTLMHPHGPEVIVDRRLLALFILNGLAHFSQALLAFSILSRVSTVTYSIVSLLKRIVVIVAAIAWFGDTVSGTQAVGVALTFVGLWLYQKAKRAGGAASGRAGHAD
ncbi:triose-phosphate transporter domain-containing protein [Catenaria anguillulae PL171]|uniref:Triose-phosphate transporter domain-containing protein n=1 Tax=Catenaria anguillulae PL171 TaxID=765915 RepID=A0A1Y2HY85_9FUNG|nr:triose-phosphate transporter domain-containing protein [Catenaria anguillulae PL171]